jgi:hypothetical protein
VTPCIPAAERILAQAIMDRATSVQDALQRHMFKLRSKKLCDRFTTTNEPAKEPNKLSGEKECTR